MATARKRATDPCAPCKRAVASLKKRIATRRRQIDAARAKLESARNRPQGGGTGGGGGTGDGRPTLPTTPPQRVVDAAESRARKADTDKERVRLLKGYDRAERHADRVGLGDELRQSRRSLAESASSPPFDLATATSRKDYASTKGYVGKRLQEIAEWGDRVAYQMTDGRLLKIGRPERKAIKNELDVYKRLADDLANLMPRLEAAQSGGRWVITERTRLLGSVRAFDDVWGAGQGKALISALEGKGSTVRMSTTVSDLYDRIQRFAEVTGYEDLSNPARWGMSDDGAFKLLDLGEANPKALAILRKKPLRRSVPASPGPSPTPDADALARQYLDAWRLASEADRRGGRGADEMAKALLLSLPRELRP